MTAGTIEHPVRAKSSSAQAWARALELTAWIARQPERIFPTVVEERAVQCGDAPALLSERESFSYCALGERANQYARWALAQDIQQGECVGVLMPNRPELLACWLGITKVGCVVALLNTNQRGHSLAHSINIVRPKHLIADVELREVLDPALPLLDSPVRVWPSGEGNWLQPSGEALDGNERRKVTIEDRALYIYTSGTTGFPKAAVISHGRVMQWTHWFAGMMNAQPGDRLYDCLPMHHSVGGVQAPGAMLVGGGSVVFQQKFSASRFWSDIVRWDCTLFQYIGELCRYLLQAGPEPCQISHRIRMACGNGLRGDIWQEFQSRFRIPQILEFYAATEGNVSLFNIEGEPGSIGRIPPYLAHRFPATLIRHDTASGEAVRVEHGLCMPCRPNEVGEAIGQISHDGSNIGGRFEGYLDAAESERKILRDVFKQGDAWFRTGDLMRRDERGFFYFVDRAGDTFRWKGENVATSEVAAAICAFPGVREASVYGVEIPGADGRAGMATLVVEDGLDLDALRQHLQGRLPEYAQPLFVRIRREMHLTDTFKYAKGELVRQGYDPAATSDPIYFNNPLSKSFVPVDRELYGSIQTCQIDVSRRTARKQVRRVDPNRERSLHADPV